MNWLNYCNDLSNYETIIDIFNTYYQIIPTIFDTSFFISFIHKLQSNLDHKQLIHVIRRSNILLLFSEAIRLNDNPDKLSPLISPSRLQLTQLMNNGQYSDEQLQIIKSTSPLLLSIAGAGTGKSHTLLGRIELLKQLSYPLNSIMAFSFTRAGAKNLQRRYPELQSQTFAQIISNLYSLNFPQQQVAEDLTLYHTLKMANLRDDQRSIANKLLNCLKQLISFNYFDTVNLDDGFNQLNVLLTNHYTEIIDLLNNIHMTTLTLQTPIVYWSMLLNSQFKLTVGLLNTKYLIVDEAQDLSIYEYILTLHFANVLNADLMLIGDPNQTLYEFRNAKADVMNHLAKLSSFDVYTLTTNYRSNQAILNVANKFLKVLSTNQIAKIQLQAFNKQIPQNAIDYSSTAKNNNGINDLVKWSINKFKQKQNIAVIAPTKRLAKYYSGILEDAFITNIGSNCRTIYLPTDIQSSTNLSAAIQQLTRLYESQPLAQAVPFTLLQKQFDIELSKTFQFKNQQLPVELQNAYFQIMSPNAQLNNAISQMNQYQSVFPVLQYLQDQCLYVENQYNEFQQNQATQLVEQRLNADFSKYNIIVSTIHSIKGLEFDNVLLINSIQSHDGVTNDVVGQDQMRLLMVGATRAKHTEMLFNHYQDNALLSNPSTDNDINLFYDPLKTISNINMKNMMLSTKQQKPKFH